MNTFTLAASQTDWHDALLGVADKLPDGLHSSNIQALSLLPIFALVVVLDDEVLVSHEHNNDISPDTLIQIWGKEENWTVVPVLKTHNTPLSFTPKEADRISCVHVFRYLLIPNQKNLITAEKKEVATHVLDDQITSYLKRTLRPKPNYNFSVNTQGQVEGFTLGAGKNKQYVDCHIFSITQMLRRHKLACFDMDSTLIKEEVMVELAKAAGVGDQVASITEEAMRGELDFNQSFFKRLALLKGLQDSSIEDICTALNPQDGAFTIIAALKALGYRTVLISGGFEPFAKYIAQRLGMDDYHANRLQTEAGVLTGEPEGILIDGKQKARIVAKIADDMAIDLAEVVCIGDGANDLPMMELADLGLAYRAKPIVQVKADAAINITGLEGVLYALGYPALS